MATDVREREAPLRGRRVLLLAVAGVDDRSLRATWRAIAEASGEPVLASAKEEPSVVTFAGSHPVGSFRPDAKVSDADGQDFDGLVIPHAARLPEEVGKDERLRSLVRRFSEDGKPIAVQGASVRLLFDFDLAEGRVLSVAPPSRSAAERAGAEWVDDLVFADDGLVSCGSGRPEDLDAFCEAMVEALAGPRSETPEAS